MDGTTAGSSNDTIRDDGITWMPPAHLHPHPLQQAFYDETSEADLRALAADLKTHGQRDPIHVMPPGNAAGLPPFTILDGTRRVRAAALAKIEQVMVLVRDDLVEADAATVEAEFLRFNFLRRQLRPLQKARIALRLFVLEKKRPRGSISSSDALEARDRVGKAIGMSGRNLNRYLNVLQTPQAVQDAVDHGRLPLVLGARVAGLSAGAQQEIAREIEGLADAKAVASAVRKQLGVADDRRHSHVNDAMSAFARQIERGLRDLDGRLDEVGLGILRQSFDTLRSAREVISHLLGRVEGDQAPAGHRVRRTRRSI